MPAYIVMIFWRVFAPAACPQRKIQEQSSVRISRLVIEDCPRTLSQFGMSVELGSGMRKVGLTVTAREPHLIVGEQIEANM